MIARFNFVLSLLYVLQSYYLNIHALGLLRNGRHVHGFLGEPSKLAALRLEDDVKDMWFEQILDHSNPSNSPKWMQRYFVNKEHYRLKMGGPIFLMVGGEAPASKRWMHEGAWIKYAEQFGALCFLLEHRFYGDSHPTSDLSTENLSYLTSEQALSDLANFIVNMKVKHNLTDSQKWIAFGGSYPGSLAAWSREKYPDLVYGAISSSGPLLAKVDFREYFDVVKISLGAYKPECVTAVAKSFEQVEILLKYPYGQTELDKQFMLCDPIQNSINMRLDLANFFQSLADNFAGIVQYNKDNSPHSTITIDEACDIMLNTSIGPQVARLGEVNRKVLENSNETCLDFTFHKLSVEMRNTSWDSKMAEGSRQWTFQTCNEFGFYQTSSEDNATFGSRLPVDFFIEQCQEFYNKSMDAKYLEDVVSETNKYYGALNPNTTNVLYIHGSIDPWHALGLTSSKNPNTPTIYIEGTAHCANMYEPSKNDPPQLVAARNKIVAYLAKLL